MAEEVVKVDKKYLQIIHDKGNYISRMLEDLSSLSSIENRQISFTMKEVPIRDFVCHLYKKYKVDIEKEGIRFEYIDSLSEGSDPYAFIDKVRIEQVVVNILTNAQRFVQEDLGCQAPSLIYHKNSRKTRRI